MRKLCDTFVGENKIKNDVAYRNVKKQHTAVTVTVLITQVLNVGK